MQCIHKVKSSVHKAIQGLRHTQLTSHTDSRLPPTSHCLSAESCPHVQTWPAASLWPGFQFCHSKWSGPACPPRPCCFRCMHCCTECVKVQQDDTARDLKTGKKNFSGFHTFLQCMISLSSLKDSLYCLKSESIFVALFSGM